MLSNLLHIDLIRDIIFPYLSISDFANLKSTCKENYQIVDQNAKRFHWETIKVINSRICMDFSEEGRLKKFNYCDVFASRDTRLVSPCLEIALKGIKLPVGSLMVKKICSFFEKWQNDQDIEKPECWISYNFVNITMEFRQFILDLGLVQHARRYLQGNWCLLHRFVLKNDCPSFKILCSFYTTRELFRLLDPEFDW